jgi:hypothetical protein
MTDLQEQLFLDWNTSYESGGLDAIIQERHKQILTKERTIMSDVHHNPDGQLLQAARALLKFNAVEHDFPEHWGIASVRKLINKSYIDRLTIAGALIAAELDRIDYIEARKPF